VGDDKLLVLQLFSREKTMHVSYHALSPFDKAVLAVAGALAIGIGGMFVYAVIDAIF
jgi:hypothetical protein